MHGALRHCGDHTPDGWIFGGEHQAKWTQRIFKKSFKFQNPLRQNYKHVKTLQEALDVDPETIHSVVVFVGDSTFKTPMPANVTSGGGYVTYIKSFKQPVLGEDQVIAVVEQIQSGRVAPTWQTHRKHVEHRKQHKDPAAERKCPKCGSAMILRTVKRGDRKGSQLWGFSNYPECRTRQALAKVERYTVYVDDVDSVFGRRYCPVAVGRATVIMSYSRRRRRAEPARD